MNRGRTLLRGALALTLGVLSSATGLTSEVGAQETVELPSRDRELRAQLQDVYSVGTFDGEAWETFGEIRQVGFDGEGNLYVMDGQTNRMIVFDASGAYKTTWGQEGEGPGEWRGASRAAVFRDGTVAIADMGHGTYQVFTSQGEFIGTAPLRDGSITMVGNLLPDPRGGALYNGGGPTNMSVEMDGGSGRPQLPEGRPIERVTLGDNPTKSVFYEAWRAPRGEPSESNMGGIRMVMMAEPPIFEPGLHTAVLPSGTLAVVDSADYRVKLLDEQGRVVRQIVRDIDPVRVTGRIERNEIQRRIDELESGDGPRMRIVTDDGSGAREMAQDQVKQMMRQRLENRPFYPVIPVVGGLAAGWEGTLWVGRAQVDPTEDGPVDLFTADGEYRGTLSAGAPGIPDAFGPDGLVAYIERDEYDVASVKVRRLPASLR